MLKFVLASMATIVFGVKRDCRDSVQVSKSWQQHNTELPGGNRGGIHMITKEKMLVFTIYDSVKIMV